SSSQCNCTEVCRSCTLRMSRFGYDRLALVNRRRIVTSKSLGCYVPLDEFLCGSGNNFYSRYVADDEGVSGGEHQHHVPGLVHSLNGATLEFHLSHLLKRHFATVTG